MPKHKWKVTYRARKWNSIGIFYAISTVVEATNRQAAINRAFEELHAEGWELFHPLDVEICEPTPVD